MKRYNRQNQRDYDACLRIEKMFVSMQNEIMALSKEIHNEFKEQFKSTCCRILTRDFQFGSPEHLEHCVHVTGAATAMVLKKL